MSDFTFHITFVLLIALRMLRDLEIESFNMAEKEQSVVLVKKC